MDLYAKVINYTIPIFLFLIAVEHFFEWRMGRKVSRGLDSVSSISSGVTNVVKDVLGLSLAIISYDWLLGHMALMSIEATWITYIVAFIVIDFKGYWKHRWEHEINFLWNRHVIHHSSEEFNLSCGLRQTVSGVVDYFFFLLLPAALLGVPVEVIAIVAPIHLFLQFWYHTRLIGKLGWLEKVIVTPSHHRVHHAVNEEYMDKNLGQIFIIWDKLFGTFQEEKPDIKIVYGITRPAKTWNPIKINYQHIFLLWKDAYHTKSWKDKLKIWFMKTGWRPADVIEKYPLESVGDPYLYQKYDPPASSKFKAWAWIQLFFNYFLLVYLFSHIAVIGSPYIFIYGAFVVLSVYAYTELMDRNPYALYMEMGKSLLGLFMIYWMGDWFGASEHFGLWYSATVAFYCVASIIVVGYFSFTEVNEKSQALVRS
ncbi:sterol desaturase family protein [Anditalea andensis]|uniref:Sterol desaturase n=1 Tax=Anditalea andensis TaxID=1048983 RepID=A0A074KQ56_9BACT|nr:sterol desaturase family protein [Anditalea andensis]KEO72076.1 sterol desaturase [Anditalea andensis]